MKIVIVGGGIAGVSAAAAAREVSDTAEITLISAEKYYPYYRLKLSEYLSGELKEESLLLHPPSWYEERKIKVILGKKVTGARLEARELTLHDGTVIPFSSLVLTTGSYAFKPPVPGGDLPGVYTLRNLDDLKAIRDRAEKARRAVVIGGGVLGLEVAYYLGKRGVRVGVVEHNDRLLPRQVDEEGSKILSRAAREAGVELYLARDVDRIEGIEQVEKVVFKDGSSVATDIVVFSTGVRPYLEVANMLTLGINRGIIVDKYMATSRENIYAAGDVAEFEGQMPGIWPVAMEQGKVAGANAAGASKIYTPIPPQNVLKVFGKTVFSIGTVMGEGVTSRRENQGDNFLKYYYKDEKLVGALLIGDVKLVNEVRKLFS
ncbi:NAD(P)/FAD-dependent oxidoreductase [Carboxydothermus ferrireducens]|uniref:Nitrite reductase (NADH) large subunit n=1 Tax=Carboxydothermus ferrireducens DSM 11255 TaxID=1119529 RepID=A0ABX2RAP9_9THEO|nr:FAD-dependent oxidoreductase [Carboxydothermus ferrireducens]NYE57667.1 nitrite reductase (NADH) large subunit [Carboxydothermus ferrireducens DSM 11255]